MGKFNLPLFSHLTMGAIEGQVSDLGVYIKWSSGDAYKAFRIEPGV